MKQLVILQNCFPGVFLEILLRKSSKDPGNNHGFLEFSDNKCIES